MAYSTIPKGTDYFNTSLWTGNGSAKTISGVGFQPDLLWAKCRSNSYSHILTDAVRGITKQLKSEGNAAELTNAQGVTAFNADGYVLGTQDDFANNGNTFVGWGWKAGTTSGIVQGGASITPSAYSFNQTSGFSIIKYQGTGSNATVPHGLNAVPKMIIIKCLSLASKSWQVGHESIGWQNGIYLNLTDANGSDSGAFNSTNPTSSLFSLGTSSFVNTSSADYVAYCFSEIPGYSKFNRYDGNGSTNGSFIYTGFKPAFVMVKKK